MLPYAVVDLRVRAAAIAERLEAGGEVLEELERAVRRAARGSGIDRDLVLALVHARLTRELPIERLASSARARGLSAAESVLRSDGAHRSVARLPDPLTARSPRALLQNPDCSRQQWRVVTRTLREQILRDPRASVVSAFLELPVTSLADVLRLASRRPTSASVARAIAASGWLRQLAVREALVRNPFTETWLSLAMLSTVRRATLVAAPLDPELSRTVALLGQTSPPIVI